MYEDRIFTKEKDILIVAFVLFDQLIKLIIAQFFFDVRVYSSGGMVGFTPIKNTYLSNVFYWLRIKPHVIVPMLVFCFGFWAVYTLLCEIQKKVGDEEIWLDLAAVFAFSGIICYLIDVVFWGGSLDYVYLQGFMVLDLKDIYIRGAEMFAVVTIIKNYKKFFKIG